MKTIALCITIIAVSATLAFADLYHDGYKEGETIGCVHFESGDKITAELMTDSGMAIMDEKHVSGRAQREKWMSGFFDGFIKSYSDPHSCD